MMRSVVSERGGSGGPRARGSTGGPSGTAGSPRDLIGTVLDGRYRVERKVGRGSLGTVYEAQHTSLTRRVAVKVLLPSVVARVGDADRFLAAVRAASKVRHPNVVDVHEFGKLGDTVYVAMDFVVGRTLEDLLKKEGPLTWRRARGVVLQIVGALKAAHKRGVLHRGLHPGNCFVLEGADAQKEPTIKVSDFILANNGFAAIAGADGGPTTSRFVGKPTYAAPELKDVEPSAQSDIYACGVLLYRMLTGELPFDGGTPFQIMEAHAERPVPPPRRKVPAIPEEIEAIILRALAKEPRERFASARELEVALDDVAADAQGGPLEGTDAPAEVVDDAATGPHMQAKGPETPAAPARDEALHAEFERQMNEPAEVLPTSMFDRRHLAPYYEAAAEQLGLLPPAGVNHQVPQAHAQPAAVPWGAMGYEPPMPTVHVAAPGVEDVPLEPTVHFPAASRAARVEPESTVLLGAPNVYDGASIPPTERLDDLAHRPAAAASAEAGEATVHLPRGGLPTAAIPVRPNADRAPMTVSVTQRTPAVPLRVGVAPPVHPRGQVHGGEAMQVPSSVPTSPATPVRVAMSPPAAPQVPASPPTLSTMHLIVIGVAVAVVGALVGLALS